MIEILQCLQLSDLNQVTSQKLSNLLLALYCLAYLSNKKGFYIGAFLFTEFIGVSSLLSVYSNTQFYFFIGSSFAVCYWYEVKIGKNIKILLAYGIMVLFQLMMVLDAHIYPSTETSIYQAYEFIVVGIHIYIVIALIKPKSLFRTLGDSVKRMSDFLSVGYSLSFCYTSNIILNQVKKTCHQVTKK